MTPLQNLFFVISLILIFISNSAFSHDADSSNGSDYLECLKVLGNELSDCDSMSGEFHVVFAGQSNAAKITPSELSTMASSFSSYSGGATLTSEKHAWSGSAVLKSNKSSSTSGAQIPLNQRFWVDDTLGTNGLSDGRLLEEELPKISSETDIFIWIQGEADSSKISTTQQRDDYIAGLKHIFNSVRTATGNDDIVFAICVLGRRRFVGDTFSTNTVQREKDWAHGISLIRQAHHMIANESPTDNIIVISESYDIEIPLGDESGTTRDDIHYSPSGKQKLLDRIAKSLATYKLGHGFSKLPTITSVRVNKNNRRQLYIELDNVKSMTRGSTSGWIFTAHNGYTIVDATTHASVVSDTMLRVEFESNISSAYKLHVAHNGDVEIDSSGALQIRDKAKLPIATAGSETYNTLLPISSGIYDIGEYSF